MFPPSRKARAPRPLLRNIRTTYFRTPLANTHDVCYFDRGGCAFYPRASSTTGFEEAPTLVRCAFCTAPTMSGRAINTASLTFRGAIVQRSCVRTGSRKVACVCRGGGLQFVREKTCASRKLAGDKLKNGNNFSGYLLGARLLSGSPLFSFSRCFRLFLYFLFLFCPTYF